MFFYLGAKNMLALNYPAPVFDVIIEPFAGSAAYAQYWRADRDVILFDRNPQVVALWHRLQHMSVADLLALPAPKAGERYYFDPLMDMLIKMCATSNGTAHMTGPMTVTARVEKGLSEAARKRIERWVRIARESSQQSRRVRVPEVLPPVPLENALSESADHRYFLEEASAPPLLQVIPAPRAAGARVALLSGPEGGWTEAERLLAGAAGWQAVSLSPRVLRSETAAAAAIAILMNAWM